MEAWNTALYSMLNAPSSPDAVILTIARLAAEGFVYAAALLAVGLWVWGSPNKRGALISAGIALLASFAISWGIGLLWYHPRPFAIGLGYTFLAHSPDSSFPSDHTTFLWTFGFSLLVSDAWRRWGWVLVLAGFVTAWARIYVGIHFPLDMAGSLIVAVIGSAVTWAIYPRLATHLLPLIERPYEASLRFFHLPVAIFPRHAATR